MNWATDDGLRSFVAAFESGRLPKKEWTHATHIAIGSYYVVRYGDTEALERARRGIRYLNECQGVENSDKSGYHETLTRFWLTIIKNFLDEYRLNHPVNSEVDAMRTAVERFAHHSGLFRQYWSYDVVASVEARRQWVAPDALPFD